MERGRRGSRHRALLRLTVERLVLTHKMPYRPLKDCLHAMPPLQVQEAGMHPVCSPTVEEP